MKKRAAQNLMPAWEVVVAKEPDAIENEHVEDDNLNEDERADMEHLRESAIAELDVFLDETFSSLEKTGIEFMRDILQCTFESHQKRTID
ncbi:hypothetical protein DVH05_026456 [Phytophthora capsici]|nr:hypothetical protein DVH05_027270 [Phytophthora capsici]KAG1707262.1 hypothetical protein DVH05_026456 [Phytophthora capsici]